MEAKLILARLLQAYSVQLPQDYELVLRESATIRPNGPMQCIVEKRL
jgi:cytochrome P450